MEILYNILTSTAISGLIIWIFKLMIERKFEKKLQTERIEQEANLKREVETYLGDVNAERNYLYEAKKRLYLLISPLNFQILIACRDISARISRYATQANYPLDVKGYFGQSTLYRLLKPLALLEIIEKNIAFVDFSVDPVAIELLKLRVCLFRTLSSSTIILNHPTANWNKEREHVFFDNISKASRNLIRKENDIEVVLSFNEFQNFIEKQENNKNLEPFIQIFNNFSIKDFPIFWIRLIAFGYICSEYLNKNASKIGLSVENYDIINLLKISNDETIQNKLNEYFKIIKDLSKDGSF